MQLDPAGQSPLPLHVWSVLQAISVFAQTVSPSMFVRQLQLGLVAEHPLRTPLHGTVPDEQVPAEHIGGQAGQSSVPPHPSEMVVPHWSAVQVVTGVQHAP